MEQFVLSVWIPDEKMYKPKGVYDSVKDAQAVHPDKEWTFYNYYSEFYDCWYTSDGMYEIREVESI